MQCDAKFGIIYLRIAHVQLLLISSQERFSGTLFFRIVYI